MLAFLIERIAGLECGKLWPQIRDTLSRLQATKFLNILLALLFLAHLDIYKQQSQVKARSNAFREKRTVEIFYICELHIRLPSSLQLQHDLDLSYPTAWLWCHKIRKAMQDRDARYALNGIIELEDTYIGDKNKHRKRGRDASGKAPVIIAVEARPKGSGHAAMLKPDSRSSEDTRKFLDLDSHEKTDVTSD